MQIIYNLKFQGGRALVKVLKWVKYIVLTWVDHTHEAEDELGFDLATISWLHHKVNHLSRKFEFLYTKPGYDAYLPVGTNSYSQVSSVCTKLNYTGIPVYYTNMKMLHQDNIVIPKGEFIVTPILI